MGVYDFKTREKKPAESLREELREKDPKLADQADNLFARMDRIRSYVSFLMYYPGEGEIDAPIKRRPKWEQFIQRVNSQEGLDKIIGMILDQRVDPIDDTVIVVKSDRPYIDTMNLDEGRRVGNIEGYIGIVQEHCIVNAPGSVIRTLDGIITERFALRNARKLKESQLRKFIEFKFFLSDDDLLFRDEIEKEYWDTVKAWKMGSRTAVIEGPLQCIDYLILDHVMSEVEKQIQYIDEPEKIDLAPYYGKRKIPNSELAVLKRSKSDNVFKPLPLFIGKDSRAVDSIYSEIKEKMCRTIRDVMERYPLVRRVDLYIGKLARHKLTTEQVDKIHKIPPLYQTAWTKKLIMETGMDITDTTIIGFEVYVKDDIVERERYDKWRQTQPHQILNTKLSQILKPKGYVESDNNVRYGVNHDGREGRLDDTTTRWILDNKDYKIYPGEVISLAVNL